MSQESKYHSKNIPLRKLTEHEPILYSSMYYDGKEEREQRLCREMQLNYLDDMAPAILIDQAVWQLENFGWVEKVDLEKRLVDGELDYTIEFTPEGKRSLAAGERFNADD